MKIFRSKYNWSVSAHSKNLDGTENKAYVDVQFPKGKEPEGDVVDGKLIFRQDDGRENECFLSSYRKSDGTIKIKLVLFDKKKTVIEQTSLTGDDTDVVGHHTTGNKVIIETDDLPFI